MLNGTHEGCFAQVVAEELGSELYKQMANASQVEDASPEDILYYVIARCDNSICDSGCSLGATEVYVQQLAELYATSSEPFRRAIYGFCNRSAHTNRYGIRKRVRKPTTCNAHTQRYTQRDHTNNMHDWSSHIPPRILNIETIPKTLKPSLPRTHRTRLRFF